MSVSSNADQDDLFSAHDFDIHIDLPTNSNGKFLTPYMVMFEGHNVCGDLYKSLIIFT